MRLFAIIVLIFFSSTTFAQEKPVQDSSIVREVDKVPQFVGGLGGWQRFLANTINIDRAILEMDSAQYAEFGLRQTAVLEFTVCEDGEVCDVEILNKSKISPAFAKEALRVMKRSPKWIPALKGDKTVRTRFRQPITAVLDGS